MWNQTGVSEKPRLFSKLFLTTFNGTNSPPFLWISYNFCPCVNRGIKTSTFQNTLYMGRTWILGANISNTLIKSITRHLPVSPTQFPTQFDTLNTTFKFSLNINVWHSGVVNSPASGSLFLIWLDLCVCVCVCVCAYVYTYIYIYIYIHTHTHIYGHRSTLQVAVIWTSFWKYCIRIKNFVCIFNTMYCFCLAWILCQYFYIYAHLLTSKHITSSSHLNIFLKILYPY